MKFYETRNHLWRPSPLDLNHNTGLSFHSRAANDALQAYSTAGKSFYYQGRGGDDSSN